MEISELSPSRHLDASSSGVSWGAVIGGAFAAAALSLVMLALGAGFELSAVSPWPSVGASASTIGTAALVWLIVTQVISSSMGGYLTGRLRTRWHAIHGDEVHFRDTANGFLAWAVALVVTAAFLTSAAAAMAGGAARIREPVGIAEQTDGLSTNIYYVDRLFRTDHPSPADNDARVRVEAGRILAHSLGEKEVSSSDTAYLARLVSDKTGLNAADSEKRVADTMAEARQSAENLRRISARLLLWTFFGLLIGAFCASYAAILGGRQRDHVQLT